MKNPCNNPKGVQGSKDAPTAPKELKVVVVVVVAVPLEGGTAL